MNPITKVKDMLFREERSLLKNEIYSLKDEIRVYNDNAARTDEMLKYIMSDFHKQIIFSSTNKVNDQIFVVQYSNGIYAESFDIYLYNIHYNYRHMQSLPSIHCVLLDTKRTPYYTGKHMCYIKINEICMLAEENKGNGSIAIDGIKRLSAFYGVQYITGDLSFVDKDRFEQLKHFYSKQGFEVTFNNERTSGKIYLKI